MIKPAMNERVDIKAIQLACRFAYGCNAVRCHPDKGLTDRMRQCIVSGEVADLADRLTEIPELNANTNTLAQITGLPQFSYPVIEAYWFGNELLNQVGPEDYDRFLQNHEQQAAKSQFIKLLRSKRPKIFIPHHACSVLHLDIDPNNIGDPLNLRIARACLVRSGEVLGIKNGQARIHVFSPVRFLEGFSLSQRKMDLRIDRDFVPDLKVGDTVAVHLSNMVKIMTPEEKDSLNYWTRKILRMMF